MYSSVPSFMPIYVKWAIHLRKFHQIYLKNDAKFLVQMLQSIKMLFMMEKTEHGKGNVSRHQSEETEVIRPDYCSSQI